MLDLYCSALRHGNDLGMSDTQLSSLVGIVKAVHERAIAERLTLEASFKHCGELLLMHSIERPPKSSAIFSYPDMQQLLDWFTDTYYLHFPLYQYAFTPAVTLDFKLRDPRQLFEVAPALPALDTAVPEEAHQAELEAQRVEKEKQAAEQRAQVCLNDCVLISVNHTACALV